MALPFCARPQGYLHLIPSSCRKLEARRPAPTFLVVNYRQFGAIISCSGCILATTRNDSRERIGEESRIWTRPMWFCSERLLFLLMAVATSEAVRSLALLTFDQYINSHSRGRSQKMINKLFKLRLMER